MKSNDEIRELLRRTDPAEGRELPPCDRARLRAMLTSGAAPRRPPRSLALLFAAGAAAAIVAIAVLASRIRIDEPAGENVIRSTSSAAPNRLEAVTNVAPPAPPVAAKLSPRTTRPRPHVARAGLRRSTGATFATQIVFTAPEGTRILWFVGNPDAKEIGS